MFQRRGLGRAADALAALVVPVLRRARKPIQGAAIYVNGRTGHVVALHDDGTMVDLETLHRLNAAPGTLAAYSSIGWVKLGVGTNRDVLHVDSTAPAGLAYRPAMCGGYLLAEDFEGSSTETGEIGTYNWVSLNIGAGGGNIANTAPVNTGWTELGLVRLNSPASAGDGIAISLGSISGCPYKGPPPVGSVVECKLAVTGGDTQIDAFAGLWYDATVVPDAGLLNASRGIGWVARAGGAGVNWYGICRNGTTESTVDLGVSASTTWRLLGFRIDGSSNVQFQVDRADVGAAVSTNIPLSTRLLGPQIGLASASAAARSLDADFFYIHAPAVR